MKISTLRRSVSGVAALALVAAGVGLTSTPASAAVVGTLSVSPGSGSALSVPTFTTSGQCPVGDTVTVKVFGGSGTGAVITGAGKNFNGAIDAAGFNVGSGMVLPGSQQWSTFATTGAPILSALNGTYTVSANCATGDQFQGQVTFTGVDTTTATYVAPIATTTTVAAITSSTFGSAKTFTATVAPAATGSVQFKDGATNIGAAAAVTAGVATLAGQNLSTGSHSITAVYTPDAAAIAVGFAGSTSAPQTFTVAQATPVVTLTNVGGTVGQGQSAVFTVAVTPATAGTFDLAYTQGGGASTPIISGVAVTGAGTGSFTWNVSPGQTIAADYVVTATFHPTDLVNFANNQTSSISAFSVTAAQGLINNETIQVTVPAGALSATVVNNPVVTLGNFKLASNGSYNIATGAINPVKVTDTRAGDLGWVMSAKASDFVGCASYSTAGKTYLDQESSDIYTAASHTALVPGCTTPFASLQASTKAYQKTAISATNLGIQAALEATTTTIGQVGTVFTPNIGVAAQGVVNPDIRLPGFVEPVGSPFGLGTSRNLVIGSGGVASANGDVIGSGTGVVSVTGALTLNIPTVTLGGAYASTLTITVI